MLSTVSRATVLSGVLAPVTTRAKGAPRRSVSMLRLVPDLARSTGLGPVASPPNGALVMTPSSTCHFQSIPTFLVVVLQQHLPCFLKHSGFDPLPKAPMHGGAGRILLARQRLPLTARPQDVDNAIKNPPEGDRPAPRRAGSFLGSQQRGKEAPQIIRDMPYCRSCGLGGHNFPPFHNGKSNSLGPHSQVFVQTLSSTLSIHNELNMQKPWKIRNAGDF